MRWLCGMYPTQTRYSTYLVVILLLLLEIYLCLGQRKASNRRNRDKSDENIPEPSKNDTAKFENQAINGTSLFDDELGDNEVRRVLGSRAVDEEEAIIDKLLHDYGREKRGAKKKDKQRKRVSPRVYLMDIDLMATDHPAKKLREGDATDTESCNTIRNVPSALRKSEVMYAPINVFYSKYTEAYGIPVVGSKHVTDEGLKRACYTTKAMFVSNYNIRNAYYKLYGRVALIADNEEQTSLYEYRTWDASYWNNRVRGLGPSTTIPLSSAGDDNQRCKAGDRYFDQDILVHELGHGVHTLASRYVIPGFEKRLKEAYHKNVVLKKKWKQSYAAKNINEYFAVGSQFYFNSFRGPSYEKFGVFDQDSLREYDSDLTQILDEVYCCFQGSRRYIHRCKWKSCSLDKFTLKYGPKYVAKSNCKVIKTSTSRPTPEKCATFTCYHLGNAFNWKNSICIALKCDYVKNAIDLKVIQNTAWSGGYSIYYTDRVPQLTVRELNRKMKGPCTKATGDTSCNIKQSDRKYLNNLDACSTIGGCAEGKKCYHPKQECTNRMLYCNDLTNEGECASNWPYMYKTCATACERCKERKSYTDDELAEYCQDKEGFCSDWAKGGECKRNPAYMKRICPASCKLCTVRREPK